MLTLKRFSTPTITLLISWLLVLEATATQSPSTHRPTDTMRLSLFAELLEHRDIVMLGDSITARGEWAEFFPGASIANRGISGDTTTGILSRLDQITDIKPKAVFIMAGINDLVLGESTSKIILNYQKIISTLSDAGANVVVQSTLYVSKKSRLPNNSKIFTINENLKDYCSTKNECEFIDLNTSMSPKGILDQNYTGDGIHLTGKGYIAWAKEISKTIATYSNNHQN